MEGAEREPAVEARETGRQPGHHDNDAVLGIPPGESHDMVRVRALSGQGIVASRAGTERGAPPKREGAVGHIHFDAAVGPGIEKLGAEWMRDRMGLVHARPNALEQLPAPREVDRAAIVGIH